MNNYKIVLLIGSVLFQLNANAKALSNDELTNSETSTKNAKTTLDTETETIPVSSVQSTTKKPGDNAPNVKTSPVRNIKPGRKRNDKGSPNHDDNNNLLHRTIDGSENNARNPNMNMSETQLRRYANASYRDRIGAMAGTSRPNPRSISSIVAAQNESMPNPKNASDFLWQWGQFLDHDLDLTDGVEPAEPANISIPKGDTEFDPSGTGTMEFPFNRSIYDPRSGTSVNNPRQQLNEITGWIDASNVYGSHEDRAVALRTNDGSGKLKTSTGNLLPFNETGLPNAGGDSPNLFVGGDVRVNEQLGLTAMHTLFMREHNRLADEIANDKPFLSGEEIYQEARRIVGAQMQVITYNEFLPVLLGDDALNSYRGYDQNTDARIYNVFSTAAYRLGHSMLSDKILRLDAQNNMIDAGHLPLREAFFAPQTLINEGGIEPMLRGLAAQVCQTIDIFLVDDVRNFLFGQPGQGGFDLASLNIQRGRDHGLASYNDTRIAFGLPKIRRFSQISSSSTVETRLRAIYDNVDEIDVWVGGLAEDPISDSMLGELFHRIVKQQFEDLRDGDRFWYENTLSEEEIRAVENTTLADIIKRNTNIGEELNDNVFIVNNSSNTIGISVSDALLARRDTPLVVTGLVVEGINGTHALRLRDLRHSRKSIIVKLEPEQREAWSPSLNPTIIGKTITVIGQRDTYGNQSSIENVSSINEYSGY